MLLLALMITMASPVSVYAEELVTGDVSMDSDWKFTIPETQFDKIQIGDEFTVIGNSNVTIEVLEGENYVEIEREDSGKEYAKFIATGSVTLKVNKGEGNNVLEKVIDFTVLPRSEVIVNYVNISNHLKLCYNLRGACQKVLVNIV